MKTMITDETKGGFPEMSCLRVSLRMSYSAFHWYSLRPCLIESAIFYQRDSPIIVSTFAHFFLKMAYYVKIN